LTDRNVTINFISKELDNMETELDEFYNKMKKMISGYKESLELLRSAT